MSSAEMDEIINTAEMKNTKENTKWAVQVFEGTSYDLFCGRNVIR